MLASVKNNLKRRNATRMAPVQCLLGRRIIKWKQKYQLDGNVHWNRQWNISLFTNMVAKNI